MPPELRGHSRQLLVRRKQGFALFLQKRIVLELDNADSVLDALAGRNRAVMRNLDACLFGTENDWPAVTQNGLTGGCDKLSVDIDLELAVACVLFSVSCLCDEPSVSG